MAHAWKQAQAAAAGGGGLFDDSDDSDDDEEEEEDAKVDAEPAAATATSETVDMEE